MRDTTQRRDRWGQFAPTRPATLARAARLCARPDLTLEQIAARLGVTRRTLFRWRGTDEFERAYDAALRARDGARA
jgi:AcrR family transcriptional regulator